MRANLKNNDKLLFANIYMKLYIMLIYFDS